MEAALGRLVRERAGGRCEYCRLPQAASNIPFEIDHIIARQHRGYCNGYKGPNLSGIDPATGRLTRLFHPRRHKWSHHFRYDNGTLIGRTAIGRTTVEVLKINLPNMVELRMILMEDGRF